MRDNKHHCEKKHGEAWNITWRKSLTVVEPTIFITLRMEDFSCTESFSLPPTPPSFFCERYYTAKKEYDSLGLRYRQKCDKAAM